MVNYKLYYFNLKGRGELARLLFVYAGQEFEDNRVEFKDWPALKNDMPFKQMPILEVDGKKLAKSHAIARFLAREFGLAGKTSFQTAKSDEFSEAGTDIMMNLPWTEKDEEKRKILMEKAINETIPPMLLELETKVEGEYVTGNEVLVADIGWASCADHLVTLKADILEATPKLLSIYKKIFAHPAIAKYVASRPKTTL